MMKQAIDESSQAVAEAERWAHGLAAVAERINRHFPRSEPRERARPDQRLVLTTASAHR